MAKIYTPIPKLKLNDGHSIPMLAYGSGTAWYKSGDESQIDRALVESMKTAIDLEYYHLDNAEVYKTESEVGMAIKESGVDRNKLYLTTKVLPSVGDIPNAIRTSLKKLQVEHVDLFLIHHPFWAKSDAELQKAWAEMEKVQAEGLAISIGVSNFLPKHLETILRTAKVPPAVNQIEFNPYLQQTEIVAFHKKHNIATEAYSPLTPITKATPGPIDDYLAKMAKKYAVNPSEILLRWCLDQDIIPITTSSKEQRLSDYLRIARFKLNPAEIEEIVKLGKQKHVRNFWGGQFNDQDKS